MAITLPGCLHVEKQWTLPGGLPASAMKKWIPKCQITKTWVLVSKGAPYNALQKENDGLDGRF